MQVAQVLVGAPRLGDRRPLRLAVEVLAFTWDAPSPGRAGDENAEAKGEGGKENPEQAKHAHDEGYLALFGLALLCR